jgi:nucleotide-binding universal stress UspA family protein
MPYPTLLLHMSVGQANASRLAAARNLAERLDAVVIGTAACDPQPPPSLDGIYTPDIVLADTGYAQENLDALEAEFHRAMKGREDRIEWRGAFAQPVAYVAAQCRAADLVITGAVAPELLSDPNWRLDPGDLVMRAGRPVLLVPDGDRTLSLETLVVGWKDNRESRRAVLDALPLARFASRVLVASIAEDNDRVECFAGAGDVVAWVQRHGITAEERWLPLVSDAASQLRDLALEEGAGIIVAGAYGHSRTREWILGGVTHDFLSRPTPAALLLSH